MNNLVKCDKKEVGVSALAFLKEVLMKREKFAYSLLAPMILVMFILVIYPIIATFSYSLKKWKLCKPNNIIHSGTVSVFDILYRTVYMDIYYFNYSGFYGTGKKFKFFARRDKF